MRFVWIGSAIVVTGIVFLVSWRCGFLTEGEAINRWFFSPVYGLAGGPVEKHFSLGAGVGSGYWRICGAVMLCITMLTLLCALKSMTYGFAAALKFLFFAPILFILSMTFYAQILITGSKGWWEGYKAFGNSPFGVIAIIAGIIMLIIQWLTRSEAEKVRDSISNARSEITQGTENHFLMKVLVMPLMIIFLCPLLLPFIWFACLMLMSCNAFPPNKQSKTD